MNCTQCGEGLLSVILGQPPMGGHRHGPDAELDGPMNQDGFQCESGFCGAVFIRSSDGSLRLVQPPRGVAQRAEAVSGKVADKLEKAAEAAEKVSENVGWLRRGFDLLRGLLSDD